MSEGRKIFDYPANKLDLRTFRPPGPVAAAFIRDQAHVCKMIMGPFGSGKTHALLFDGLGSAIQMPKCTSGPFKGHRVFRDCVIRDTYANLWDSTIPSWFQWFDEEVGDWTGSRGRQAVHKLVFDHIDQSKIFYELHFRAIQDKRIENVVKGTEYTRYGMEEADQFPPDVAPYLVTRAMQERFPPKAWFPEGTKYHGHVAGSFNPADPENYLFDLFEVKSELLAGRYKLYKQPSGRSANGENHKYVSRASYEEQAAANVHQPWFVKRNIDGEWGYSRDGLPVYADEYDDAINCAEEELKPVPGLPIRISFDQGVRGPAMVIGQKMPSGQLRLLDEVVPMTRMGPTRFADLCKAKLQEPLYAACPIEWASCDPAGWQGSDSENGDLGWAETVSKQLGIAIMPAPTNELNVRLDAVSQLLLARPEARTPGLLISPRCKTIRKGFMSHYRYKLNAKGQVVGSVKIKPEKNEYSDPHDALQYLALDLFGLEAVLSGQLSKNRDRGGLDDDDEDMDGTVVANHDFDVLA